MPGFTDQLRAFKAKTFDGKIEGMVHLTVEDVGERVSEELSPVGDPALWKNPGSAPVDYVGGEFASNWFVAAGAPSTEFRPGVVNFRGLNGLAELPEKLAGLKIYISNSDPKAISLEYGHSSQAPVGILGVIEIELPGIAESNARKVASQ